MANENPRVIGINELESGDYQLLRNAKTPEALNAAINSIEMKKGGLSKATFSPDTRRFLEIRYAPQVSQQTTSQASSALSPLSSTVGILGAAALATATADTSGSWEVADRIDHEQLANLFGEKSRFEDVLANGTISDAQLESLSSDSLLGGQYTALERRVAQAGIDAGLKPADINRELDELHARHIGQIQDRTNERNDPKKTKQREKELDEEKKRKDRLRKDWEKVDKETTGKGRKKRLLSNEEKKQRRAQLLQQYATEQQRKNRKHLEKLLSERRFLGLGKKSTLQKPVKKVLLKSVRTEREGLWKEQERQRKAAKLKRLPGKTPPEGFDEAIVLPTAPSFPSQAPPSQVPQSTPQSSTPSGLGLPGIPGGIAKKAIASNPTFWGGVGGAIVAFLLLLMVIVFIVILFKLFGSNGPGPLQLTQLSCGNQPTQDQLASTYLIDQRLGNEFHLHFSTEAYAKGDRADPTALSIVKSAYNTVCILFGQTTGSPYVQKTYNTFGKDLVGNYGQQIGTFGKPIAFIFLPATKDKASCSIEPQGNPEKDPEILWNFFGAENCLSIYQLQFRIAHALGLSLLYQQEYLLQQKVAKDGSALPNIIDTISAIFPDFPNITILNGKINALPTTACTKAIGTPDFMPECFADMVGEYLTYPYYLDGATTGLMHGAFIAGTIHDIDVAATAGMTYIINYDAYGGKGVLDMSTPEAKEMAKYNIKDVLDVWNFDYPKGCNTTSDDVVNFVKQYYQSPNLGGYWIKDDPSCGGAHFKMVHDAIRSVDSNTSHLIMAGFWDLCALKDNYADGMMDIAAFYPYPGYGTCDGGVENEIPKMAAFIKSQKNPVPFIGIYQAFWSDSSTDGYHKVSPPSQDEILTDVKLYMENGASGVVAFSVGHPGDVNKGAGNDPSMLNLINAVRDQLGISPLQPQ